MKRLALRHVSGKQFTCVNGMRLVDITPLQVPTSPVVSLSCELSATGGYMLRNNSTESVTVRYQGATSRLSPKAAVVVAEDMELHFQNDVIFFLHSVDESFPLGWSQIYSGHTNPTFISPEEINQYFAKFTGFIDKTVVKPIGNILPKLPLLVGGSNAPEQVLNPDKLAKNIQINELRQVDSFVCNLPTTITLNQLVGEIASYSNSAIVRCLASYFWVVDNIDYDADALITKNIRYQHPNEIFLRRRGVCMHYACLFDHMSRELGVVSRTVTGHATTGHNGSRKSFDDSLSHAWNIATVEGNSIVIDTTWGAGFVSDGKFTRRPTDYWFDVPPKLMISTHYPSSPSDQLLDKRLPGHEWLTIAPVNYSDWYSIGFSKIELVSAKTFGRTFSTPMSLPDDFKVDIRTPLFESYYSNETLRFQCHSPNYAIYLCNGGGPKQAPPTTKLPPGQYSVWIGKNGESRYWSISEFEVLQSP